MMLRRRGSLLLEVSMAATLLAIAFIAVAQLLALSLKQRRETEWRHLATREAANVMERIVARPWDQVSTPALRSMSLPEDTDDRLPDARLKITVHDSDEVAAAKQIRVQIDWRDMAGARVDPIRLVAWQYRAAHDRPREAP